MMMFATSIRGSLWTLGGTPPALNQGQGKVHLRVCTSYMLETPLNLQDYQQGSLFRPLNDYTLVPLKGNDIV